MEKIPWAIVTIIVGILFAIPAVIGYSSMKWTDYLAVPGGLLLCIVGIYLALKNVGWSNIISFEGDGSMTFAAGVTTLLGMNVSQWVISADYTRYAKAKWKDNILIPLGIIAIGIPLVFIGGVMGSRKWNRRYCVSYAGAGLPGMGLPGTVAGVMDKPACQ